MCKDKPLEGLDTSKQERYTPTKEELEEICKIPKALTGRYPTYDPEEIESLGNLGLAKGIGKYDPNKQMKFRDFIFWYSLREVRQYFKLAQYTKSRATLSLANYEETVPSKESEHTKTLEDYEYANHLLSYLTGLQKDVVVLAINGMTHKEIGDRLNLCPVSVRQRYFRAINKLRHYRPTKLRDKDILSRWEQENPKKCLRAKIKGSRTRLKKLKRDKKLMGWGDLTLGQCKVLCLMADGKSRTIREIRDELRNNYIHSQKLVYSLKNIGYLESTKWDGKNACIFSITEKALKERKKNNVK